MGCETWAVYNEDRAREWSQRDLPAEPDAAPNSSASTLSAVRPGTDMQIEEKKSACRAEPSLCESACGTETRKEPSSNDALVAVEGQELDTTTKASMVCRHFLVGRCFRHAR